MCVWGGGSETLRWLYGCDGHTLLRQPIHRKLSTTNGH